MIGAVIAAAGEGRRYGERKQFAPLGTKHVLWYALEPFLAHRAVESIVVVLPPEDRGTGTAPVSLPEDPRLETVPGGPERQESVYNGIARLPESCRIVLVHDGARPLLSDMLLEALLREATDDTAVVPGIPVSDTVKEVLDGEVVRTVDRKNLYAIQTPQVFPYRLLREAHERARSEGRASTDDAELVEAADGRVRLVPGDTQNIKITTPFDLEIARLVLAERGGGR